MRFPLAARGESRSEAFGAGSARPQGGARRGLLEVFERATTPRTGHNRPERRRGGFRHGPPACLAVLLAIAATSGCADFERGPAGAPAATGGGESPGELPGAPDSTRPPPGRTHNPGWPCLRCHLGGSGPDWLFGGTVIDPLTDTGIAEIEVVVSSGGSTITAFSDGQGNFYRSAGSASLRWSEADIRLRGPAGERTMTGKGSTEDGDCNRCHQAGRRLLAP